MMQFMLEADSLVGDSSARSCCKSWTLASREAGRGTDAETAGVGISQGGTPLARKMQAASPIQIEVARTGIATRVEMQVHLDGSVTVER